MAVKTALRRAARRLVGALRDYAGSKGWGTGDYKIFLWLNVRAERVQVIFLVKEFPAHTRLDSWIEVRSFLEKKLKKAPDLVDMLTLSILTFAMNAEGGLYAIPRDFVEPEDL